MDLKLTDSVAVITGAASGIGRACAIAFAEEGARVGLLDRNHEGLVQVEKELHDLGAETLSIVVDVVDEAAMATAINQVATKFGRIDAAISCAGITGPFRQSVEDISLADWNHVLAVNVTGPFLLAKYSTPHLRIATSPTIVMIASDSSFVAAPGMVPYNASKGAVLQLMRALSVDLSIDRIRVNCVCPSIVDTPMARSALGIEIGGFATFDFPVQSPAEVASHVLYLSSPISRPVNGTALISDFGYLARSSFPA
jgi:NAD(P)-dependent dehydrogenase (short-subunit alcohol dehydrogenase family)